MATNRAYADGRFLYLPVASGVSSGDPVLIEDLPGVALNDRDSDDKATVDTGGVYKLEVIAEDHEGTNTKVDIGKIIYWDDGSDSDRTAGDLVPSDGTNGKHFGYALEEVAEGDTATIEVKIGR